MFNPLQGHDITNGAAVKTGYSEDTSRTCNGDSEDASGPCRHETENDSVNSKGETSFTLIREFSCSLEEKSIKVEPLDTS